MVVIVLRASKYVLPTGINLSTLKTYHAAQEVKEHFFEIGRGATFAGQVPQKRLRALLEEHILERKFRFAPVIGRGATLAGQEHLPERKNVSDTSFYSLNLSP